MIADSIRGGANLKFRCDPCTARRRRQRITFYAVLALLAVSGLLLRALHIF
jgi:hypothetical protein